MLKQLLALASLATLAGGAAIAAPQVSHAFEPFGDAPTACIVANPTVTVSATAHSYQYDLVTGSGADCGPFQVSASFDLTKGQASERLVAPNGSFSETVVWNCPGDPWGTHAPSPCTFSAAEGS